MSRTRKIFLFVALPLIIILAVVLFFIFVGSSPVSAPTTVSPSPNEESTKLSFTAKIFDPSQTSYVTPLGEVNGGYDESQAISGIMVWNKAEAVAGNKMVDVYAPAAMTLETYSYHSSQDGNTDWVLIFRLNKNVTIKYDHITQAVDKIITATTSTPKDNSAEVNPKTPVNFTPGELVAMTSGTKQAKNWNIYMYDKAQKNKFVNQTRYEASQIGQRLITGVCPFSYYESSIEASYLALMGATKAGQTATCGNVSKDVTGTLSGMWHFGKEVQSEMREEQDGNFASPLSIYKNSAGQVIIDRISNRRRDLEQAKDPTEVTTEYCYALNPGYAYFKLSGQLEMSLAQSTAGSCPSNFPATGAKTYYR